MPADKPDNPKPRARRADAAAKGGAKAAAGEPPPAKKKSAAKGRSKKAAAKKNPDATDPVRVTIEGSAESAESANNAAGADNAAGVRSGGRAPSARGARPRAVIVQDDAATKFALLESALEGAGFWHSLDVARQAASLAQDEFRILIKPDLTLFDRAAPTGTDPELVEHLIDLLHERGYTEVAVGDGRNSFDLWLENRDVLVLAEMAGYRYVTERGRGYEIVDLGDDLIEVEYPAGSALSGTGLSRAWAEAHYRIGFAKNKTDEEDFYALGLHNLLGVLPLRDKDYHYRHRLKPWDVCLELLRQTPVHFAVIDAVVSNHGSAGTRAARPVRTQTVIASADLLLADWAAAAKMGLDPHASRLNARALADRGLPAGYEIVGDRTPYRGWTNVHPLIADSVRRRNEWAALSRAVKPWLQAVNPELFPFKDAVDERVNARAADYLSQLDDNPTAFWAAAGLNYWLGAVHRSAEALRTLYRKDSLSRIEAPINIDLSLYGPADYEGIVAYLEPLAELIGQDAADANGLRWRYLDGSVLFEFSRVIPAPFDDFVARVDIGRSIEFMNDYIGGVAVPVGRDSAGRVVRQAERNLYLTQPNYLVLYEGKVIDVTKLEFITYAAGEQRIYWKTLKSENDSAAYDDGIVTFARTGEGETSVTVFGRQQFTLPLFWQAVNLDLTPPLKDFLVTHAYTTFFTQTLANFEAKYEGRDIRIGRPWNPSENEPGAESGASPTERLAEAAERVGKVGEVIGKHFGAVVRRLPWKSRPAATDEVTEVDADGFTYFKPGAGDGQASEHAPPRRPDVRAALKRAGGAARAVLGELGEAVQKDLGAYREDD